MNTLHRAGADATLTRDLAHAFAGAQLRLDALFDGWINFRPTKLLALCDRALKASVHALTDHAALKLGKGMRKIARELGVGTGTVQRVKQEMEGPFVSVAA